MPAAPAAAPAPAPAAPVLTPAHGYALGIISEGSVAPPDRVLAELINCGAPTTGQYAQNGLWDDSDDESDRGAPSASGSTSTDGQQRPTSDTSNTGSSRSWRQRLSSTSVRAPKTSRRGILSMTTTPVGEAPWPWGRKSVQSVGVNAAATAAAAAAALPARTSLQLGAGSAPVVPPAPVIPSTATFAQLEAVSPVSAPDTASTVSTPEVPAPASAPAPATASIPAPRPMQERVMSPFPPLTTVLLAPPAEPSRGTLRPSKSRTRLRSMGMGNRRTAPPPPAELAKKVDKKIEVFESPVSLGHPVISDALAPPLYAYLSRLSQYPPNRTSLDIEH
jgi:hypothetical protein